MSARPARRALVLAALAVTAFLVSSLPASLHGTGIVPVLALAVLDVALVQATGGLAFARARSLDERADVLGVDPNRFVQIVDRLARQVLVPIQHDCPLVVSLGIAPIKADRCRVICQRFIKLTF